MVSDSIPCASMSGWSIAVHPEATESERYAAQEFQRGFAAAAAIELPIVERHEDVMNEVRVGAADAEAALGEEGYDIAVEPNRMTISGGRPRGTLYGVYQFLEEFLGLRYLTHDHTHLPDARDAALPCGEWRYVPPLSYRNSAYRENREHPHFAARLRVNTESDDPQLGGKTPQDLINHSFHRLVPFDRYGSEHPEYYALFEGQRDTDTKGAGPQLCVTNSKVLEIATAATIQHLDENPGLQNFSVSQADTDRYCHCDSCEELNREEGTPMGSQLAFVNAVAEQVERTHPDVKVGTLAYWYTRKAPKTIRPRPNVQIQLCSIECCTLHAIDEGECPKNREFCRDMDEWSGICDDIWIWNYNTNFKAYDLPFPNLRSIGPNVRYFHRNHVKGAFMQADHNGLTGELCDLRNYVIAKLLWNPELDADRLRSEFVELHYGTAAAPIGEYLDLFHDHAEAMGVHPNCFPSPEEVGLDAGVVERAERCFERAFELAGDDEVRSRVEKASISILKAQLVAGGTLKDSQRTALIDRYIDLCQRHGMTHAGEHKPAGEYFQELRESS